MAAGPTEVEVTPPTRPPYAGFPGAAGWVRGGRLDVRT